MTMTLIRTATVGAGGATSIDFTSIPQDGTDLILWFLLRGDQASPGIFMSLNGLTTNFTFRNLLGNGSSASSSTGTEPSLGFAPGTDITSNTFSSGSLYLSNYTSSTNKTISADNAGENNATVAYQNITALISSNSSAVTSIGILCPSGNWAQNSTASLYKITKGSDGIVVVA